MGLGRTIGQVAEWTIHNALHSQEATNMPRKHTTSQVIHEEEGSGRRENNVYLPTGMEVEYQEEMNSLLLLFCSREEGGDGPTHITFLLCCRAPPPRALTTY